jgi:MFS transporter, ACS family, tartrate transporter
LHAAFFLERAEPDALLENLGSKVVERESCEDAVLSRSLEARCAARFVIGPCVTRRDELSVRSTLTIAVSARRKSYTHVILPIFLTSVVAYLDRQNLSYAKLTMNSDLGFTEAMYGFGAGIFFAGYLLFEIPGALIAERYSARLWLARIMISWGVLSGMMAFISKPWHFYTLRFLIGVAEASLYPVLYAIVIPRWFNPGDRARAIALMLTSLQVSAIVGAPLAGWLLDVPLLHFKGWQVLFLLEALPAIVLGVILVRWLADWPEQARWLTSEEKAYLMGQYENELHAKAAVKRYTLWQALCDREVLRLCGTYFLWMTGFWGFNYYTPTILKGLGWSHQAVGWLVAAAMVLSLVAMLWVGHHSSKTGEKRWHGAASMFLAAAGMLFGTLTNDPIVAWLFLSVAGVGVYAALGVWWSYPTTFLSGSAAAGAVGLINSIGSTGGFLGPYLTGLLKETSGSYTSAWLYLAFSLACAGVLILTFKRTAPAGSIMDHTVSAGMSTAN